MVCPCLQAATNEVVAASVMCLPAARLDRPMAAGRSAALRHFSVVRKLDGLPFPAGKPRPRVAVPLLLLLHPLLPCDSQGIWRSKSMSACMTPVHRTSADCISDTQPPSLDLQASWTR